jgi:DNA-directed RNA polymerase specialized sigma24 family protein
MALNTGIGCDLLVVAPAELPCLLFLQNQSAASLAAGKRTIQNRREDVGRERIIYRDWIVELGQEPSEIARDASRLANFSERLDRGFAGLDGLRVISDVDAARVVRIKEAVNKALKSLDEEEQEFVVRFYYMGQSYSELAKLSGRSVHKLETLHRQVIRRLRNQLAPFVEDGCGPGREEARRCPICSSPRRREMDELIRTRNPKETWRRIMRRLKREFEIDIKSPTTLAAHEKYHV